MIKCPECSSCYPSVSSRCPQCCFQPLKLEGVTSWAPRSVDSDVGYEAKYFTQLVDLEPNNFWFCSRNRLIIQLIKKFFPTPLSFMEVGCGTGFVLSGISKSFPQTKLTGSELLADGLCVATKRLLEAQFVQMDARCIPYKEEFSVVGAFDVLEHIEEDEIVLKQIFEAIIPGGGLVLTVPQHPTLWSFTDEQACHVRRYRMGEIDLKVKAAGFEILRSSSFVSLLVPFMFMSRIFRRKARAKDVLDEFEIPKIINRIFKMIMTVERSLIMMGISFPVGGSRIVIARKN